MLAAVRVWQLRQLPRSARHNKELLNRWGYYLGRVFWDSRLMSGHIVRPGKVVQSSG